MLAYLNFVVKSSKNNRRHNRHSKTVGCEALKWNAFFPSATLPQNQSFESYYGGDPSYVGVKPVHQQMNGVAEGCASEGKKCFNRSKGPEQTVKERPQGPICQGCQRPMHEAPVPFRNEEEPVGDGGEGCESKKIPCQVCV